MAATKKDEQQIARARTFANVPWDEQYERMISGMLYDSFVPQLKNARYRARAWCHEYNNWFPSKNSHPNADLDFLYAQRAKMHIDVFGRIGRDVTIEPPFLVEYGCNTVVGDGVYANFNLTVLDCALVSIGDRVMFGPGVSILTATHETEVQSRRDNIEYAKPITIGDDCWIGGHVVILPGVTIGEGCTIAASSVVTKDIPPWSVAIGSPARVRKQVTPVGPSSRPTEYRNDQSVLAEALELHGALCLGCYDISFVSQLLKR